MEQAYDATGQDVPAITALAGYTLVRDSATGRPMLRIEAVLPLPVGALIELPAPAGAVRVAGVRLLVGTTDVPAVVCLDVEVPPQQVGM